MKNDSPFIIDTDPWCDDALAIMLAIRAWLNIRAVTTVCWNVGIDTTTRNAAFILELLGSDQNVKLYRWAERPLEREPFMATVHWENGLWEISVPNREPETCWRAVEAIVELAKRENGLKIIALWPLTNVALAIREDPDAMSRVSEIIIMWWAFDVPGNSWAVSEFNFFADPEAAYEVIRFPIPKTLVPLDACNRAVVPLEDFYGISWEFWETVRKIVIPYARSVEAEERLGWAVIYDALAVYYALEPSSFECELLDVSIETKGGMTRGMSVADRRKNRIPENPVNVAVRPDPEAFRRTLFWTLG